MRKGGSWKDFRKEILLIVISAEQKLVHFCSFPLSVMLDDNFFFLLLLSDRLQHIF